MEIFSEIKNPVEGLEDGIKKRTQNNRKEKKIKTRIRPGYSISK